MVKTTSLSSAAINALTTGDSSILYNNQSRDLVLYSGSLGFSQSGVFNLEINNINGECLKLKYNSSPTNYVDFNVTSTGQLNIIPNGTDKIVNIYHHNESTSGLSLGGTLITASANELNKLDGVTATTTELNYVDTTQGIAEASKALVVDANRDISNIRNLQTENLTVNGTLVTSSATELNYNDITTIGTAEPGKALVVDVNRDISNIRNVELTNNLTITNHNGINKGLILGNELVSATASEINILDGVTATTSEINKLSGVTATTSEINKLSGVTATTTELNYIDTTPGTVEASKAIIVDANRDITNIRNLQTENLTVNGTLITASASELNYNDLATIGTAEAGKALVVDLDRNISNIGNLTATNLTGTLQTSNQQNITSVGTLTELSSNGNVNIAQHNGSTTGLQLNGSLVTATANEINVLDGITSTTEELNILDGVTANANEINVLDGITASTAELNILDGVTATYAEINVLDGITASTAELNILDGVTATTNEINVLDGITASTAELNILDGVTATANEINVLDGITASTAELNILDGVTATANEINYNDLTTGPGIAEASKALILDSNKDITSIRNLTATNLTGTLQTSSQPNITSVGTLSTLILSGAISGVTTIGASGIVTLSNNTASTTSSNGALVVTGGVGIGGALNVTGGISGSGITGTSLTLSGAISGATIIGASGVVTLTNNTASTSASTGALKVTGGVGIGGALNVTGAISGAGLTGTSLTLSGTISGATTIGASGVVTLSNSTASTTASNGALVVTGGVGIGGALNVTGAISGASITGTSLTLSGAISGATTIGASGIVTLTNGTNSTNALNGALRVSGGVGIFGSLNVGTNVGIGGTLNVTSTISGAGITGTSLTLSGAISGATIIDASGVVTLSNSTASTTSSNGALVVTGGVGIGGALNITGAISGTAIEASGIVALSNSTASTSTTTGALVVTGGIGIGGALNLSGSISGATTIKAGGLLIDTISDTFSTSVTPSSWTNTNSFLRFTNGNKLSMNYDGNDLTFRWINSTNYGRNSSGNPFISIGTSDFNIYQPTNIYRTFQLGGDNYDASNWGKLGIQTRSIPTIYTDTGIPGSIVYSVIHSYAQATIASLNTRTIDYASTLYIDNSPIAGTNTTITNSYSLHIGNGKVLISDTTLSTSVNSGALLVSGGVGISGSCHFGHTVACGQSARTNLVSWGNSGIQFKTGAVNYTTSSTGILASNVFNSFARPTLSGSMGTTATTTEAATVYIDNSPLAGSNMTITNAYSLWINSGITILKDTTPSTTASNGALVVTGGIGIGGALNVTEAISGSSLTLSGTISGVTTIEGDSLLIDTLSDTFSTGATPSTWTNSNSFVRFTNGRKLSLNYDGNDLTFRWSGGGTYGRDSNGNPVISIGNAGFNIYQTTNVARTLVLGSDNDATYTSWGTSGIQTNSIATTYTDRSSAGSVTNAMIHSYGQATIASLNARTITNSATLYIANSPDAGSNTTITNSYALLINNGRILLKDTTTSTSTTTGALIVSGGVGIGENLRIGGILSIINTTSSTTRTNGALVVSGGIGTNNLTIGGNRTLDSWSILGPIFKTSTATLTDNSTGASGTANFLVANSFETPTFAATNTNVTTSTAVNTYIRDSPIEGTNMSFTQSYALYIQGNAYIGLSGTKNIRTWNMGLVLNTNGSGVRDIFTPTSGTISTFGRSYHFDNTIFNATNTSVTMTNGATVYIDAAPSAGTNMTITNAYSLYAAAGRVGFADTTESTSTTTGALVVSGGVGIGGALNINGTITTAGQITANGKILTNGCEIYTGTNWTNYGLHHSSYGDNNTLYRLVSTGYVNFPGDAYHHKFGAVGNTTLELMTNDISRMLITSDGNICTYNGIAVNTTSFPTTYASYPPQFYVEGNISTDWIAVFKANTTSTGKAITFRKSDNTEIGSISFNASSVAYNTTSDYRLKKDIEPLDGLNIIMKLNPIKFKWKSDDSYGDGFIAHELQEHYPSAVIGEKDALDPEGNPDYQCVSYSNLVGLAISGIKEQQELIINLDQKNNELENKITSLENENKLLKDQIQDILSRLTNLEN